MADAPIGNIAHDGLPQPDCKAYKSSLALIQAVQEADSQREMNDLPLCRALDYGKRFIDHLNPEPEPSVAQDEKPTAICGSPHASYTVPAAAPHGHSQLREGFSVVAGIALEHRDPAP